MKVLGIDTASAIASVAVVEDQRIVSEARGDTAGHRADLLLLIDGLGVRDFDAIAIGAGPGSFTGLRVGMATAKGIAFAMQRPLWAVSSLAALAHGSRYDQVTAVLDARRGEVYAGSYRREGDTVVLVGDERVLAPSELAQLSGPFVGDATYPELASLDATWGVTPSAASVALLALAGPRVDILLHGAPTYIRPSEAEVKYPDGVPGALRKR